MKLHVWRKKWREDGLEKRGDQRVRKEELKLGYAARGKCERINLVTLNKTTTLSLKELSWIAHPPAPSARFAPTHMHVCPLNPPRTTLHLVPKEDLSRTASPVRCSVVGGLKHQHVRHGGGSQRSVKVEAKVV